MHKLVMGLTLSTLALGSTTAYLLWQRGHGVVSDRAAATDDAALREQIALLKMARSRLEQERLALEMARGNRKTAALGTAGASAQPANAIGPGVNLLGKPSGWKPHELTPEQRNVMARQHYGMLFHELALSEAEIAALLPVLSAQDQRMRSPSSFGAVGALGATTSTPEQQGQNAREVAVVLGPERAAQFESARKTLPARSELRLVSSQLEQSGEPLSADQQRKLTAIMSAREPRPPLAWTAAMSDEDRSRALDESIKENARRFREEAAPILTPQQLQREALRGSMRTSMVGSLRSRSPGMAGSGSSIP